MTEHWAITLYKRYVELYGAPIEQPLPENDRTQLQEHDSEPGAPVSARPPS